MKKYLLSVLVALMVFGIPNLSSAQQLLDENFNYPASDLITAHGWVAHSGSGTQPITVSSAGLTFTGYISSGVGNAALADNTGEDDHKIFVAQTSGVVYTAFMVNVTTTAAGYFFHLGGDPIATTFRGKIFMDATNHFGLSKGSNTGTFAATTYTPGVTYLLVLKYEVIDGTSNDIVSLFIFDSDVPSTEPATPTIGPLEDIAMTDINPAAVSIRQFSSSQNLMIDGIRVGLTWADVLPSVTVIPPTTQTSNLTFANVLQTQMDVSWTNGNGARRVVKMNTSNAFTAPVDGTDPAASAVWANAGEQVVFNGSGSTIPTVTGLDANTTYWFQAWEYNGTGTTTLYCTATGANNPLSQITAATATAPVITSPTATSIGATSAILGGDITADGGAPILERGTVWSTVSPVTIADNKLAEGGMTTGVFSHLRSGMPANTPIYYAAFATNSAGTSLTAEMSFTTLLAEPTNHAASFAATALSYSSIVTTWLDNDGAQPATGFVILANTTGTFTDPVDGIQPASDASLGDGSGLVYVNHGSETFTWTGLSSSTPYYFAIYAYTNTGTNIDYKTDPVVPAANVTTLPFISPIAAWTFDDTPAAPNTPTSVTANFGDQTGTATLFADGTNGSSLWLQDGELNAFAGTTLNDPREGGSILAGLSYDPIGGTDLLANGKSMVIKFSMSALQDPILTFATRGTSTGFNTHQWAWSTDGVNFTDFGDNTAVITTSFVLKTLDMTAIDAIDGASSVYLRITFSGASSATGNNRLDNIVIHASAASTLPPTVATTAATAVTAASATLNGTVNANNQSSTVAFEFGAVSGVYGAPVPGVPAIVTGGTVTPVSADISGLDPNTTYYYRISATNGSGTSYGSELTFVTGCLPADDAGQISGPAVVYADGVTEYQYSVPAITNAVNYIWSFPLPSTIVSGDGTNMVTVVFNTGAVSGDVSVFGTNACDEEGGSSEYAITVYDVAATTSVSGSITAGNSVCYDATQTITVAGNSMVFEVFANGSATMIAGVNILYLPGTIIHSGAYMLGTIAPGGPFCPVTPAAKPASVVENGVSLMDNSFKIYPNPTTGIFTIEQTGNNTLEKVRVEVLGTLGGKILTTELLSYRKQELSIKGNSPGIYFVKITAGTRVQTVKIILTN